MLRRLQVEQEGFLAGLDLEFSSGLNVIIGARGTGKTSVVELIRYALSVGGFTEDAEERGALQATAILQGGAASVTFETSSGLLGAITRSGSGYTTPSRGEAPRCTILAQNEVEAIGAQASGRLHLLDRFREGADEQRQQAEILKADIESLTRQVADAVSEGTSLAQQASELQAVSDELSRAKSEQQELLLAAQASEQDRAALARLEAASNTLAERAATVSQTLEEIGLVDGELSRIQEGSLITIWPGSAPGTDDPLQEARDRVNQAYERIDSALEDFTAAADALRAVALRDMSRKQRIDEEGRRLRRSLDAVQSGVGLASRRVQELEERLGQLVAVTERLKERRKRFVQISTRRDGRFEDLESLRQEIYNGRMSIASGLNHVLGPQIRVRVDQAARTESYQAALVAALRGSGLHYNALAPALAKAASPIELVNWVERSSIGELSSNAGLSRERAVGVIAALRSAGLERIVSSDVEDEAIFELLDGRDYKSTDRLSIGQRCTVVLPLLLGQHGDTLIVDQPEDHLDNAFIASTLVAALNSRRAGDQFIFTSHNANIPVLGEADNVIVMNSDGDRAYVTAAGPLDDPVIVQSINDIMEGGPDAFATRSEFYASGKLK